VRLRVTLTVPLLCAACAPAQRQAAPSARPGSCGPARVLSDMGRNHIEPGKTVVYPSFPPASGPHDPVPLPAGVYDRPLSHAPSGSQGATIFRAVHSLEHGYVLVFHQGLSASERAQLRSRFGKLRKVIVTPASGLGDPVELVAWRRVQACSRFDVGAIAAFIDRFRETTAPEPGAA
jgi:hypothetical protein